MIARGAVWIPAGEDSSGNTNQWEAAEVLNQGTTTSVCATSDGRQVSCATSQLEMKEALSTNGVNDLTELSYLHEPAILDNLRARFFASDRKIIYTYCGHICIAVNPFEWLRDLYTVRMMKKFRGSLHEDNQPHIYAAAEAAFSSMMTRVKDGVGNQSILVSGESGAGKTESVKIIMEYLAQAAGRRRAKPNSGEHTEAKEGLSSMMSDVACAVMKSNPLLEAFGNARTLRNDNSSRFGKFTRILFDDGGTIVGSRIDVYLLEKSRVVHQATGERSFHVFYQLLRAPAIQISMEFRQELGLRAAEEQNYLSSSGCTVIDNVSDEAEYNVLVEAMGAVGLSEHEQHNVARVVAVVLMLGHVAFEETIGISGEMQAVVSGGSTSLGPHANLLGCVATDLATAIVSRQICARDEWYTIQLTKAQAEDSREGLAKALYERLFMWLVERVNISTTPSKTSKIKSKIGILDIFGFESFQDNSFEQLLINFANEKLQQQFTWYVFKLEQEEYNREGIKWTSVDFQDNQPVLDTIEGFGGVIPLLDEESHLQRGCDQSFVLKLKKARVRRVAPLPGAKLEAILSFPRMEETNFVIRHYAGFVEYCSSGFRLKNKDALHPDMVTIVRSSSNHFVKNLFPERPSDAQTSRGRMPTLAAQFKVQLNDLVDEINQTAVHYVRCIKPNQHASPSEFEMIGVHEQLRCQGILEAIRIARAAYPNRLPHSQIVCRYTLCLSDAELVKQNPEADVTPPEAITALRDNRQQAEALMKALRLDCSLYQVGITKVFFKRAAMEELEASRGRVVDRKLTALQAAVRAWVGKRTYQHLKVLTIAVQARSRRFILRHRFVHLRCAAIVLQSACRVITARNQVRRRRFGIAATLIQRQARRSACHGHYLTLRQNTLVCQKQARRVLAMRNYIVMRDEAREDAKLVNIVAKLQDRLQEENVSVEKVKQLEEKVRDLEEHLSRTRNELEQTKSALREQGKRFSEERSQRALYTTADGIVSQTDAQKMLQQTVDTAVTEARTELLLRIDAQQAELQAARVGKLQSIETIARLEKVGSSLQQMSEQEQRSLQRGLEISIAKCCSEGHDEEDAHAIIRRLQQQLAVQSCKNAITKTTAVAATEALSRYQGQLLHVMSGHEDRTDLLRTNQILRDESRLQSAEIRRLSAECTDVAAKLASANAQLRIVHLKAPQSANACVESAVSEMRLTMEKINRTHQLHALACQQLADAAVAKHTRLEKTTAFRVEHLNDQLQRQRQELNRLHLDQQDTHLELARCAAENDALMNTSDSDTLRTAINAAKTATTECRDLQCERQVLAAETELRTAVSRAEFAELQLKNHLQTLRFDQAKSEAEPSVQKLWNGADNNSIADNSASEPADEQTMETAGLELLQSSRNSQMQLQLQNRQNEQEIQAIQINSSNRLQVSTAEASALKLASQQDASTHAAVEAAMKATGKALRIADSERSQHLERQLITRTAELDNGKGALILADSSLRTVTPATEVEPGLGKNAGAGLHAAGHKLQKSDAQRADTQRHEPAATQADLDHRLRSTRAELQAERKESQALRGKLEKLTKNASDLQLVAMASPLRGDRKKLADELARARNTIEDKNSQLAAATKKQLLADRKQAELTAKKKSSESALQNAKLQVRKFVEDAMTLTQGVKRIEDILGFPSANSRQSSKDLNKRLDSLLTMITRSADFDQQISGKLCQLRKFRKKLSSADLDELWQKHRGEDQKELLRMCNSICAAVRTQALAIKEQLDILHAHVMHDTQVSNVNLGGACVSTSPNGWDMRNHIKEKAELALAFVDAAIDESNLYRRINEHMYHMVGPVRDEALVVKTIHSQNDIPALVTNIYMQVADGRDRFATAIESTGLTGYIRRCFLSCDGQRDLTKMHKQLVSTLEMMEAANKLDTLDWEGFPLIP